MLCHDVLQHRGSIGQVVADVATLASSVRPGGTLSLLAPNLTADVVAAVLRDGPAQGGAEVDAARTTDPAAGRSALRLDPLVDDLENLEVELSRREEFRRCAQSWQLAARRP